jgi:hypothetical protein
MWLDKQTTFLPIHPLTCLNSLSIHLPFWPLILSSYQPIYMSAYASTEQCLNLGHSTGYSYWSFSFIFQFQQKNAIHPWLQYVVTKILHLKMMCCHHCQLYQTIKLAMEFKCWLTKLEERTLLIFLSRIFQSILLHSLVVWWPLST